MNLRLIGCAFGWHKRVVKKRPEWDVLFGDMVIHEFRCAHCHTYIGLDHIEKGYM